MTTWVNEFDNLRRLATGAPRKEFGIGRSARDSQFTELVTSAYKAGHAAATTVVPPVMVVTEHASPLDDNSPVVQQWVVPAGPCGFAEVKFKGNTAFGRWMKAHQLARHSDYEGGNYIWVSAYDQSVTRKECFARAFAQVLREGGVADAYSTSRLD